MNRRLVIFALCGAFLSDSVSARVFNSSLKLKVYARGSSEIPDHVLGFTPSRRGHPVHVPSEGLWYVRPIGPLRTSSLDRLTRLIKEEKIPGLDLSDHWELTNESVSHLRSLTRLAFLDISRTKISDAGLAHLKSCRALSVLMLPEAVTDKGLAGLRNLQNLREINLDQTHMTDEGINILTHFPHLQNLDLSSTHTTDAGVALLRKIPHLKRLVLGAATTDACAPHLEGLQNLREIDISQTQIGEKGLGALGTLPKLRTVYLGKQVTDAGLKALSKSPSLRALDLTRTGITDAGVKHLAQVKTLQEVALGQTSVGNSCLSSLAELPELRMLELSDTRVTSAGLAPLARLKKLEVISLSWQKLTREDLQGMAKLKQLKTIILNGVPMHEETMVQLRQLGSPSPWDSIAGLERARLIDNKTTDQMVLSAPVPPPATVAAAKKFPELPKPTPSPTKLVPGSSMASQKGLSEMHQKKLKALERPADSHGEIKVASIPLKPGSPASVDIHAPSAPPVRRTREAEGLLKGEKLVDKGPSSHPAETIAAPPVATQASSTKGEKNPTTAVAPVEVASKKVSEENLLQVITLQSNPAHAGPFSGLSGMRQIRHSENVVAINTISSGGKANIADQEEKPENYLGEINANAAH